MRIPASICDVLRQAHNAGEKRNQNLTDSRSNTAQSFCKARKTCFLELNSEVHAAVWGPIVCMCEVCKLMSQEPGKHLFWKNPAQGIRAFEKRLCRPSRGPGSTWRYLEGKASGSIVFPKMCTSGFGPLGLGYGLHWNKSPSPGNCLGKIRMRPAALPSVWAPWLCVTLPFPAHCHRGTCPSRRRHLALACAQMASLHRTPAQPHGGLI